MYTINDIPEQYTKIRKKVEGTLTEKIIGIIQNDYYFTVVMLHKRGVITLYQSLKGLDRCGTVIFNRTDLVQLQDAIKKTAKCDNT
ncbi:hypothetical protein [Pectinatus haikarae]|uniref:Uncharacterized protein n=1 Tax=Pectinatus haikarae TaxID=349096 RepID=A0ABT9Y8D7_9FIRM|nr:hypothetical protein [Pectinatus haikarae]MDQ0204095.1 hypothetical protein [Pectinatus haikarae]